MNKQKLIPVYARIITDKKIELATTIFIKQSDWNEKVQRLKTSSDVFITILLTVEIKYHLK